jgi:hypothetical protein
MWKPYATAMLLFAVAIYPVMYCREYSFNPSPLDSVKADIGGNEHPDSRYNKYTQ